jgi:hypothetical protein
MLIHPQVVNAIMRGAEEFCTAGVTWADLSGQMKKVVCRLVAWICDRPELETLADCPHQQCLHCARLRQDLHKPGIRCGDCKRFMDDLRLDMHTAIQTGTWRERPGQPGPPSSLTASHTVFWDQQKLTSLPRQGQRLQACLKSLRITQQSLEGNALASIPYFDVLGQVTVSHNRCECVQCICIDVKFTSVTSHDSDILLNRK